MELNGNNVVVSAADDYEDLHLWYPCYRMKEAAAEVKVVGTSQSMDVVQSEHGYPLEIGPEADETKPDESDAVSQDESH